MRGPHQETPSSGRRTPAALASLLALLFVGLMFPHTTAAAAKKGKVADLFRRQQEIEHEKAKARERVRRIKRDQVLAGRQLRATELKLRKARDELIITAMQLHKTRAELNKATSQLAAAQARLKSHREAASERLVAIYEHGGVEYLDVLTAAVSFADFANRLYLVRLVVDQDLGLMRAMEKERERIGHYRSEVQTKERAVAELETRAAVKHEVYVRSRAEKAHVVSDLGRLRAYWERALAQMEADSRDIEAQIRRYQRTTGRVRYATPWRGSFMRPVSGPITSGFGYRMHPILGVRKMHTGIDISASTGTPIRAADGGTVIWSGPRGGYGLCVIIDHGGGMATVYGHCSRLAVSVNSNVRKGDVIGYVGSTGLSTGPHLHFEVRRNGSPINPLTH
jgi:murein DD-endopeptidase MepM/ murein hydrolase activator NlpD